MSKPKYIGKSADVIRRIRSGHCSGNVEGSTLRLCIAKKMGYGFKRTRRSSGNIRIRIDLPNRRDGENNVSKYIRSGTWKYVLCESCAEALDFKWYAIDQLNPMLNVNRRPWNQMELTRYRSLLEELERSSMFSCEQLRELRTGPGVCVFFHKKKPE